MNIHQRQRVTVDMLLDAHAEDMRTRPAAEKIIGHYSKGLITLAELVADLTALTGK